MLMRTSFAMLLIVVSAAAAEKKIKMQDMPAAVQQAVKDQSKGAVIRGFGQEVENGKTLYEMELTVSGHAKDVTFDGAPAREAIQKAVGKGKLQKVESVTENGSSFYEASIRKAGKSSEFKVDATGAAVK